MNAVWALCLLVAAIDGTTSPPPPLPVSHIIPENLSRLLATRPELIQHHEGYLRQLAARPDLAKAESAWWQASSAPALRRLALHFEEALADNETAMLRFNAYFHALVRSPEMRSAVETLVRTELERARTDKAFPPALRFMRANPDIGLRFLKDPKQVRPLPAHLERAYAAFEKQPEWRNSLFEALDAITRLPDAHMTLFPWWRELDALESEAQAPALDDALQERPNEYWMWHQRNLSLANVEQAAPWMRYWSSLIHRDPDLAKEYGPFMTQLLEEPEMLRQHLADLQDREGGNTEKVWPPESAPPKLEPLSKEDPFEKTHRDIKRPTIERPDIARPQRPTVDRPQRPASPARPTREPSSLGRSPQPRPTNTGRR